MGRKTLNKTINCIVSKILSKLGVGYRKESDAFFIYQQKKKDLQLSPQWHTFPGHNAFYSKKQEDISTSFPPEVEFERPVTRSCKVGKTMEELEDDEYYIMHRGNLQSLINKTYKDHFKGDNDWAQFFEQFDVFYK